MVADISNNLGLAVRFAQKQDVNSVMAFIETHWKNGHILSQDQHLFEYLYLEEPDRLNFVIASDISEGRDVAILGYIPTNSSRSRVSLALWKAVNDKEFRALHPGLACFRYLIKELSPESLFCVGINASTRVIYEFMGYYTGLMNHHFVLNNNLTDYKIIMNPPSIARSKSYFKNENYSVNKILGASELRIAATNLSMEKLGKDADYLCHRYVDHPIFKYEIIEVMEMSKIIGIVIYRRCFVQNNSCVRIIDVAGGAYCLKGAMQYLTDEMMKCGDEYIDLVSWGLDNTELENIGFIDRREYGACVVPEHFSPYMPLNKDIWFFSNLPGAEQFFKGDGDLDRPN